MRSEQEIREEMNKVDKEFLQGHFPDGIWVSTALAWALGDID